ncbi:MAG: GNAT family N-acyltransferase [Flavobacteriales bacterium]|nr:GNAT family N-acyltransferase [Flavobacteriales bacterium]
MEKIISTIPKSIIKEELSNNRFIRSTNYASHEIYIVNHHNSPNTVKEIGRLREITFRESGGGTGKPLDLDEFDTREEAYYEQLIVWDPEQEEIIGGYRFIKGEKILNSSKYNELATNGLFNFNGTFIKNYLPYTIELGRSFVQPNYQPSSGNKKAIFSLDNLWDGLGALVVDNPEIKHFFGKVTMYLDFHKLGRDYILGFFKHFFPDKEELVTPIKALKLHYNINDFSDEISNLEFKDAYRVLSQKNKELGANVPPLIGAYMNLSASMKSFGTALNQKFGDVEETGILISIDEIYPNKKERHISTYKKVENGN